MMTPISCAHRWLLVHTDMSLSLDLHPTLCTQFAKPLQIESSFLRPFQPHLRVSKIAARIASHLRDVAISASTFDSSDNPLSHVCSSAGEVLLSLGRCDSAALSVE